MKHPDLPGEIWKPIPSLAPHYEASSLGRIRRVTSSSSPNPESYAGKVMDGWYNDDYPYLRGVLRGRMCYWHVLIYEAFTGHVQAKRGHPDRLNVIHLDGNVRNNVITNLATQPAIRRPKFRRRWHSDKPIPNAKLNPEKVREIRQLANHLPLVKIAERMGVSSTTIYRVVVGIRWKEVV